MAQIKWITPQGDLGTYPETSEVSIQFEATNPISGGLTYQLISGVLPSGMQIDSAGLLYGFPVVTNPGDAVSRQYRFSIRAKNTAGQVADRTFTIGVNGIIPPSLTPTIEDLGIYFDSEPINLQLGVIQYNPQATIKWSVASGSLPPGLTLTQAGLITGFALAPPAAGAAGTASYDAGRYDEFVWDFEGASLSRAYQFTIRVNDGINYTDRKYKISIYSKSYFLTDNTLISADNTIFTADRDGYQYPSITTSASELPSVRQQQAFAFQFKAYFPNSTTKVYWRINSSGPARFDQGAAPSPDDNGSLYSLVSYDDKSFDQTNLELPDGLFMDENTGWLTGTVGDITVQESNYEFDVIAYIRVPISSTGTFSIRESKPVKFTLRVLQSIEDLITWDSPADLGTLDNGRISTVAITAHTESGTPLVYSVKSGQYVRMPQGLQLLSSGLLAGRCTFDYFSLDRYKTAEVTFNKTTNSFDSKFRFTIVAQTADGVVYDEKEFTLTVRNINKRPFENLYYKALLPGSLREIFRSIVNDPNLLTEDIIYRADDPYFGIRADLTMLAIAGLNPDTPSNYIEAMADNHYNRQVNFGTIKKAVARNTDGTTKYEVLYVDVINPNSELAGDTITKVPGSLTTDLGLTSQTATLFEDYDLIKKIVTSQDDFGLITDQPVIDGAVYSNSFANMTNEVVTGIGYEYQGALPEWMLSVQPSTGAPLGYTRCLVLAYANPGQGDKLLYRYTSSLLASGFGISDIMNTFRFEIDRYQWDRQLSINYDSTTGTFVTSAETSFDRIPSTGTIDRGAWLQRDSLTLSNLNGIAYSPTGGYVAVGDAATILTSVGTVTWTRTPQIINLEYQAAPIGSMLVGDTSLTFNYSTEFAVGDELVQKDQFSSSSRSYISSIVSSMRLNFPIAYTIPSGTTLEVIDSIGDRIDVTTIATAGNTAYEIEIDSVSATLVKRGYGVMVKGIDVANACVVSSTLGNTVTLSNNTTNVIPAGTHIEFNDLSGNVVTLVTDSVTALATNVISFTTTLGNVSQGYYPRISLVEDGSAIQALFTNIEVTNGPAANIAAGTDLYFTSVITSTALAGNSYVSMSNTQRIALGAELFSDAIETSTTASAAWGNVTLGTSVSISLPTASINGTILRGMQVRHPSLPSDAVIDAITVTGANTVIRTAFTSANIVESTGATLTFSATPVSNTGTRVIAKTPTSITLSDPLLRDLNVGADALIGFGLSNTELNNIAYDNDRWLIVGSKGLILSKATNEPSWSQRYAVDYGDVFAIGYGNGVYVAVGSEGLITTSPDLENWTPPIVTLANTTLRSVLYRSGTWVIVGDGGLILTSVDDGATWVLDSSVTTRNLNNVDYINNEWVVVGQAGIVLISSDAITWNTYNAGVTDALKSVAYLNNSYITVGSRGAILISDDGRNWEKQTSSSTATLNAIAKNSRYPTIVGSAGTILTESDSFTVKWAIRSVPFEKVNNSTVTKLAQLGYRVSNGDTLIFAQQEGFENTTANDGWTEYTEVFDDSTGFGVDTYNNGNVVPGYLENFQDSSLPNKRAGIWRITVDASELVTLSFIRQVGVNQVVTVINDGLKLFYDPVLKPTKTVPEYSLLSQQVNASTENTRFDSSGTRWSTNRDNYTEPGTLDKYLKFPKTGVFR